MKNLKNLKRLHAVTVRALTTSDSTLDYARTLDALRALAVCYQDCDDDAKWYVGEHTLGIVDLLIGTYRYCVENHGGQWSPEYALLCVIDYDGPDCTDDSDEAEYVMSALAGLRGAA